jgi:superfamily I DNA/RNA helicase
MKSVKKGNHKYICTNISNYLSHNKIPIYLCDNEQENTEDLMNNKFVFMSVNKSKGLERKIVFLYLIDEIFDRYNTNDGIPNILYVGLTRSLEKLIIFD